MIMSCQHSNYVFLSPVNFFHDSLKNVGRDTACVFREIVTTFIVCSMRVVTLTEYMMTDVELWLSHVSSCSQYCCKVRGAILGYWEYYAGNLPMVANSIFQYCHWREGVRRSLILGCNNIIMPVCSNDYNTMVSAQNLNRYNYGLDSWLDCCTQYT